MGSYEIACLGPIQSFFSIYLKGTLQRFFECMRKFFKTPCKAICLCFTAMVRRSRSRSPRSDSDTPTEPDHSPTELDTDSDDSVQLVETTTLPAAERATIPAADVHAGLPTCIIPYYHWGSMPTKYARCCAVDSPNHRSVQNKREGVTGGMGKDL